MTASKRKKEIETVAVFCSSRGMKNEVFVRDAEKLGSLLYPAGVKHFVYGGGTSGLMGVAAASAQKGGCKITGIITHAFRDSASYQPLGDTEDQAVRTLNTRKARMIRMADAIIILPGGIGTMGEQWAAAELLDMQMASKSEKYAKPILVLNSDGIYNGLKTYMKRACSEHDDLIHPGRQRMIRSFDTPEEVIAKIQQWSSEGIKRVSELVEEYNNGDAQKRHKLTFG